jgi:hypothetical protein
MGHGTAAEQVISNDLVTIQANATEEQAEQLDLTTHQRYDIEEAQSHQSGGVCDEHEIVAANGPQRGPRSNGGVIDPRTKDTPGTGGRIHDLMYANDSSSEAEEDSDEIDPKSNTSNYARPRAKRASGANFSNPETPGKRRKTLLYLSKQMTCSAVNDRPESLVQPPQVYQLVS